MNLLQEMYNIFCGAVAEDIAVAKAKRGDSSGVAKWQIAVVGMAFVLGIAMGIRTLFPS